MPVVKKISYNGFSRNSGGEVAYAMFDGYCVFSGITNHEGRTSTINAAEEIIQKIMQAEGISPLHSPTFYDLQTWMGYADKKCGQYCYDRVNYHDNHGELSVSGWQPENCPLPVHDAFDTFIGILVPNPVVCFDADE